MKLLDKILLKILHLSDNFFAFICGVFSNIPITLIFTVQKFGFDTKLGNIYATLSILLIVISFILMVFVFMFSLRKMKIQKEVDSVEFSVDMENVLKSKSGLEQQDYINEEDYKFAKKSRRYLYISIIGCFISFIIMIAIIVCLWWIYNIWQI